MLELMFGQFADYCPIISRNTTPSQQALVSRHLVEAKFFFLDRVYTYWKLGAISKGYKNGLL